MCQGCIFLSGQQKPKVWNDYTFNCVRTFASLWDGLFGKDNSLSRLRNRRLFSELLCWNVSGYSKACSEDKAMLERAKVSDVVSFKTVISYAVVWGDTYSMTMSCCFDYGEGWNGLGLWRNTAAETSRTEKYSGGPPTVRSEWRM